MEARRSRLASSQSPQTSAVGMELMRVRRRVQGIRMLPFVSGSMAFVEVRLEDGATGVGCTQCPTPVIDAIINQSPGGMSALLLGRDFDLRKFWKTVFIDYQAQRGRGGEGGYALNAASALEMAFWDAVGRSLNLPLSHLAGSPVRDRILAYASMTGMCIGGSEPRWKSERELVDEAVRLLEQGFRALKIGWGDRFESADLQVLRQLRKEIGSSVEFMIDVGCPAYWSIRWDAGKVERVRACFEEIGLSFLEEPLPPRDWGGYRNLRSALGTRIAGGESLGTVDEFETLLANESVDIIQPDVAQIGISQFLAVGRAASSRSVQIIPHSPWAMVIIAAHLQLLALFEASAMIEYPALISYGSDTPLRKTTEMLNFRAVEQPYLLQDGYLELRDAPGLGIGELNPTELSPPQAS